AVQPLVEQHLGEARRAVVGDGAAERQVAGVGGDGLDAAAGAVEREREEAGRLAPEVAADAVTQLVGALAQPHRAGAVAPAPVQRKVSRSKMRNSGVASMVP